MKLKHSILPVCTILLALEAAIIIHQLQEIDRTGSALDVTTLVNRKLAIASTEAKKLQDAIEALERTEPKNAKHDSSLPYRFRTALQDPVFRQQVECLQRQWILDHYNQLFKSLNLDPVEKEKFIDLLEEKQLVKTDAGGAIQDAGLVGSGSPLPLIAEAQRDVNNQIEQLLGSEKYKNYYNFEMTDGLRTSLSRLQSALVGTSEPLSDSAVESMVNSLYQAMPPAQRGGMAGFTGASAVVAAGLVTLNFSSPIPVNAPSLLGSQLSQSQISQLNALIQQQHDELKLRSMVLATARTANNSQE